MQNVEQYSTDPLSREQHLLADLELNLRQAGAGKRFANYLIDFVGFIIVLVLIAVVYIAVRGTGNTEGFEKDDSGSFGDMGQRLLYSLFYGLYMFLVEWLFKGKSLGKLITGTRAVNEDGSPITAKQAFLRGLSRAVPFEGFSALGNPSYPWHDKWTHTYVIDEKLSMIPEQG